MADSTRRSGRATKGQHSKNVEAEEVPPAVPKRSTKGKKKNEPEPAEEEEEGEDGPAIIRCICGYIVEDEDDDRKMICCEKCDAWQHNECMEVSENDSELPEQYFCEQCRPKDHKSLLAKIARGEKPWEERAKQREKEEREEEERRRNKKGKKGKRGRPSAVKKDDMDANGTTNEENEDSVMIENSELPPPPSSVVDNNKRKLPEQLALDTKSSAQTEPPNKTRKVTSPPPTKTPMSASSRRKSSSAMPTKNEANIVPFQTELVNKIDELQSDDRRRAAGGVVRMIVDETKKADKSGTFNLPSGQSVDDFGLKLGLSVEFALYLNFWGTASKPSEQYTDRLRGILFNVKANSSLRDRVLSGDLPPNELTKMSREDMASKELKERKADMLKEAEKQHTLIQEEGPRIRRTHKGEELVDDQSHMADGSHTAFTAPIRKRPSEIDTSMKDASPEPFSAVSNVAVELPSPKISVGSPEIRQATLVDKKISSPVQQSPALDRSSASKFDIQNVLSQITTDTQRGRLASNPSETPVPTAPQQADAEIDQLLKDEEAEDEEPYSPKEFTGDSTPGVVWRGSLGMPGVASFKGKAKHCAGADLSSTLSWSELIPQSLGIQGRIDIERASSYLCGLKWSTTTDLVVVSVTPDGSDSDLAQFNKLYKYFLERNRYGVINKDPSLNSAVRDIYLIPIEAGTTKKPEFIELLDVCTLEDPVPERMLLLSFVVKLENSPSAQQTPRIPDPTAMVSPIGTANPNNANPPIGGFPGFQSPPQPYSGPVYPQYAGSPLPNQLPYSTPPQTHPQQSPYLPPLGQQQTPALTGMDAARYTLGELAGAPAVASLLGDAPQTSVQEFLVIKRLLDQNPTLCNDYNALKDTMTRQYHNG